MTDPVLPQFSQVLSQQALAKGLEQLLQSGPLRGLVQNVLPDGKTTVQTRAGQFQLSLPPRSFDAGQQVLLKLLNGQISLEALPKESGQPQAAQPGMSRSIAQIITQLGAGGANAEVIAKAMLQSNVPLEPNVIKELMQVLGNISQDSMQALSFLLSRRLPISDSMVTILMGVFSRRERIGESTQKLLDKMKSLETKLSGDEENEQAQEVSRTLGKFHDDLSDDVLDLPDRSDPQFLDELERQIRSALTSAEAVLSGQVSGLEGAFPETLVQLLSYLMKMQPFMMGTPYQNLFTQLVQDARSLNESLVSQQLHNIPPIDSSFSPHVYVQIPFRDANKTRQLEIRYQKKDNENRSGKLDLRIEMSNLGPLLISIHWQHPKVTVTVATPSQAVKDFLEPALESLKEALEKLNYQPENIAVVVREVPDTIKPDENETRTATLGGIDIRA